MKLTVLGVSSGTSVDGVDLALCSISSSPDSPDLELSLLSYSEAPWDPALRNRILALVKPGAQTSLEEICDLNFAIGEQFAGAIATSGIDLSKVDLISSHGQTMWHIPPDTESDSPRGSTLQLGESAVIAARTGKTVVADVRVAELARGRHGAPLSAFFERAILLPPSGSGLIVSQNIGGIGNLTAIPSSGSYLAFDTGPGNVLMDTAVRILSRNLEQYDRDGARGKRGESRIDHRFVEDVLEEKYYSQPPPKTTGRELFSEDMARHMVGKLRTRGLDEDAIVATLTRLTAESIARAYRTFVEKTLGPISEIYLCGGGALNPNIFEYIAAQFPNARVSKLDSIGIRAEAKEACMFATLGFLCLQGRSVGTAPEDIGGGGSVLGKISPGSNYDSLMRSVEHGVGTLGRIVVKES